MWLKISYKEVSSESYKDNLIVVSIETSMSVPVYSGDKSIRVSKIFPLIENNQTIDIQNCTIHFFDYNNPFRILGKINQTASAALKQKIYFSYGTCSVIIFCEDGKLLDEYNKLEIGEPNAKETWIIENGLIKDAPFSLYQSEKHTDIEFVDYSHLPIVSRSILDESVIAIQMLKDKEQSNGYTDTIESLIEVINRFIIELNYLTTLVGCVPYTLYYQDINKYQDPLENQILQQQIIDRLIQINSTLSYVSTQTYSGSIPILERRSLIRRSSLLGIGAAIKALNGIVDYIEDAFATVDFVDIIENVMHTAAPLENLGVVYKKDSWFRHNIDILGKRGSEVKRRIRKLAYFSSRNSYRESEFTITASLNSICAGISLEWTLMTITHEMLHSHVRAIMTSIFYEDDDDCYKQFFLKYRQKILYNNTTNGYTLIDSVREAIFTYCMGAITYGSITSQKEFGEDFEKDGVPFLVNNNIEEFYKCLQVENRNINEIFVHVLDLHYFYLGRTSKYISLIWCSWSTVPHVNGDIRQYILRSLVAIASKQSGDPYTRWEMAIDEFKNIIDGNKILESFPIISKLQKILNDKKLAHAQ
jgi:hypothetical protein